MSTPHVLRTASLLYLTARGRRSGLPRTVELWFAFHDGQIYLLGHRDADWVRNALANPQVAVRVGGMRDEGTAREAPEATDLAYRLFAEKYGADQVRYWYGRPQGRRRRTVAVALTDRH